MDRKLYQWISALVRDKPGLTTDRPVSQLGQKVQTYYGFGHLSNSRLIFSAEDKRRLRQQILAEVGLDPFTTEHLPENRLEMAQYHANEKLAAKPASEDQLLLNSQDGIIRINNVEIQLYPQSLTSAGLICMNSSIETIEHDTIVVVENLAIMPLCHAWQIPCIDPKALWLYRGDHKSGAKANACRDFVERFGADNTIIVFSDMDPKGLEIAATLPFAKFWLGPNAKFWRPLLTGQYASHIGFDTQFEATSYLLRLLDSNSVSEPFKNLISVMSDERSSFRQEHTYSHNVPLELIPIRVKDHS
ncbi:hypothetical protein PL263_14490 [Methylomonas sp. EFPC3]|uniref:DUF7281 domain-containing protein n=1 Tax=Methylomonas sp. EFPC3 TaxID=3021710 RepID=UPI00241739FD|nr:hypothetical protein [Methylomonas sp. EFPC3]WFP49302.1 hypothetical protein PL263_14490 [Methylomonas sp. EFPC3]